MKKNYKTMQYEKEIRNFMHKRKKNTNKTYINNLEEEALLKMKETREKYNNDTENMHNIYDLILCELLYKLGYENVVKEFINIPKWYA